MRLWINPSLREKLKLHIILWAILTVQLLKVAVLRTRRKKNTWRNKVLLHLGARFQHCAADSGGGVGGSKIVGWHHGSIMNWDRFVKRFEGLPSWGAPAGATDNVPWLQRWMRGRRCPCLVPDLLLSEHRAAGSGVVFLQLAATQTWAPALPLPGQ